MEKTIKIDGKDVRLKANAMTAIIYRREFQKDLFSELSHINPKETTVESMEIIYELAYVMAKQGDKSLDLNFDEWLDSFEVFPIEQIANETLMLWQRSNTGLSTPKKQ